MLVFLFHAHGISLGTAATTPTLPMSFIIAGNTGVTLFFVLSGFLLSLPWLQHILNGQNKKPDNRRYYLARALRILPLYYAAIIVAIVASGNWESGLRAAVFGFVGFDIFPYSVVWWTLSTEVQFYLTLPLFFAMYCAGGKWRTLCVALLLAWLTAYVALVAINPHPGQPLSFFLSKSLFARLPAFLAGIAAALFYLKAGAHLRSRTQSTGVRWLGLCALVVLFILLARVLQTVITMGDRAAEKAWHLHHSYEAVLWAAIILLILIIRLPMRALLVNRLLAVTGKLSYSIYLNHVPILFYLVYTTRASIGAEAYATSTALYLLPLAALIGSLALSWCTYRYIELPFLRLKHRIPR